jgi:hypothetical protein
VLSLSTVDMKAPAVAAQRRRQDPDGAQRKIFAPAGLDDEAKLVVRKWQRGDMCDSSQGELSKNDS